MRLFGLFIFALLVLVKPEDLPVILQAAFIAGVIEITFRSLRKMLSA